MKTTMQEGNEGNEKVDGKKNLSCAMSGSRAFIDTVDAAYCPRGRGYNGAGDGSERNNFGHASSFDRVR